MVRCQIVVYVTRTFLCKNGDKHAPAFLLKAPYKKCYYFIRRSSSSFTIYSACSGYKLCTHKAYATVDHNILAASGARF